MKRILFYVVLIATVALSSCYPAGPEYVEDMDVVITNYDNAFDFKQPNTFSLPEHVLDVVENPDPDNPQFVSDVYAKPILDRIRKNMLDRGYSEVADKGDLMIYPAVLETDITTYYDYWYGYWGGGYYGWYYPPYYTSYTFTVGTVLINMIDGMNINPVDSSRNMVWFAGINGLTGSNYANTTISRINTTIDRAFTQSPYIKND